jgi:type IV pilus assembly protein PilV
MKNKSINYKKSECQSAMRSGQVGSILIEGMVTVVITAVGLLGIVALLLSGITSSNKSLYRSTAVHMANEIAERMRANVVGVKENAYVGTGNNSIICRASSGSATPSSCSAVDLAAYDVHDWKTQIARFLPGGSGTVTNINNAPWAANQNQYEITVSWLEDKSNATQMNFKLRFEP